MWWKLNLTHSFSTLRFDTDVVDLGRQRATDFQFQATLKALLLRDV